MHDREDAIRALDELLQTSRGLTVGHQTSLRESCIVGREALETFGAVRSGLRRVLDEHRPVHASGASGPFHDTGLRQGAGDGEAL
jgi:hypothetical protein